jgi:hypothetical protein
MNHRKIWLSAIFAIAVGIVVTWLSGFVRPFFPLSSMETLQWGSPFPYLDRVVTFPLPPTMNWTMAFVDFAIWALIAFVILYLAWPECEETETGTAG